MLKRISVLGLVLFSSITFAKNNVIHRCDLTNGRTVTVTLENDVPVYRYGKNNTIEMSLPKNGNHSHVKYANFSFSGGGGEYYRFINGNYSYVVYTGIGRGWERNEVLVYKGHKKLSTIKCKSKFNSSSTWSGRDTQYDESDSDLVWTFSE